jgi:ABC-type transporter Mla subunit MlaD
LFLRTATDFPSQDHATTQDSLNELRKSIEGTKDDLEDQLDQVRHAISGAGASLRDLLQADQAQLQSGLESLAQAQRVAETTQPRVVITRNLGGQESSTLFGTDTSRPQFHLTVSDNEAQLGAVMAAGVHSPETLQALLRGSRTADLVLVLQALQNQPQSTSGTALQSILNSVATGRTQGFTDGPSTMNAGPKLSISDQEETPRGVEIPGRSTSAVHKDAGKYDEALR